MCIRDRVGIKDVVANTLMTLHSFPDRRLIGEQVIWSKHDTKGYLSSHRVLSTATNLGDSDFGKATGKKVNFRTVIDLSLIHIFTVKAQVPRIFPISPKRFLPALAGYSLGTAVRDASGDVIIPRYSLMMPIFTGARLLILRRQWIGCWKMQRQERYRTVSGRQKRLFMRWPEIDGGCPLKG